MKALRSALVASLALACSSAAKKIDGLPTVCREGVYNCWRQVQATLFSAGYYPTAPSVIAPMRGQLRGKRQWS